MSLHEFSNQSEIDGLQSNIDEEATTQELRLPSDIQLEDLYPLFEHALQLRQELIPAKEKHLGIRASSLKGIYGFTFGRDSLVTGEAVTETAKLLPDNSLVQELYLDARSNIIDYWDFLDGELLIDDDTPDCSKENPHIDELPHEAVLFDPSDENQFKKIKDGFYLKKKVTIAGQERIYCFNYNTVDARGLALNTTMSIFEHDRQLVDNGLLSSEEYESTREKLLPKVKRVMKQLVHQSNQTDGLLCYYQNPNGDFKKDFSHPVTFDSDTGGDKKDGRYHDGYVAACEVQAELWKAYDGVNREFGNDTEIQEMHLEERRATLKAKFNKHFLVQGKEGQLPGIALNVLLHEKNAVAYFPGDAYAINKLHYIPPDPNENYYIEQNSAASVMQARVLKERVRNESIVDKNHEPLVIISLTATAEDIGYEYGQELALFDPTVGIKTFSRNSASPRGEGYHNGLRANGEEIAGIFWTFLTSQASQGIERAIQDLDTDVLQQYSINPNIADTVAHAGFRTYIKYGSFVEQVIKIMDHKDTLKLHNDGDPEQRGANLDQTWSWAQFMLDLARMGLFQDLHNMYRDRTNNSSSETESITIFSS